MMELGGDDASIVGDEIVLRRVAMCICDENLQRRRPSTQSFKQDGADGLVSVYLSSEATPETVASGGPEKYLAAVKVDTLRSLGLGLVRDLSSGGSGHCVITGRKTKAKLNQIVREAEWVEGYSPEL
jgi:hypothetical protein